jgi:sporulation protein YlmC with PRC-barrel domain
MKYLAAAAIALLVASTALAQRGPGTDSTAPNTTPTPAPAAQPAPPPPAATPPQPANTQANADRFVTREGQDEWLVGSLWNKNVYNAAGKSIGDLKDVLIGKDGKVSAIVVGVGGFLGLGEKDVAVNYDYLKHDGGISPNRIVIDMSEQDLRSAPTFSRNQNTK